MRVLNVNSFLDFKSGGGTAERTFQMSRNLALAGVNCTVLTINTGLDVKRISALAPVNVVVLPLLFRRFFVPIFNWKKLCELVMQADAIHLMGHWSFLNTLIYIIARRYNKPYVVCPAGALPIFGRSKSIKRIYNFLVGHALIHNASAWIAVTAAEFPHFESYGIHARQVVVIPNGVSTEDFPIPNHNEFLQKYGISNAKIILFVGRLNLIKGPDLLLKAFALIHNQFPDYQLVFVGPDEGMLAELKSIVIKENLSKKVTFLGYLDSQDKFDIYHHAKLLVVSSRQEAMSLVALEAGICGTPVLLTDQCGFGEITLIDKRLEVPANELGIANGLVSLLSNPVDLDVISIKWKHFVYEKYTWQSIVPKYINLYVHILKKLN